MDCFPCTQFPSNYPHRNYRAQGANHATLLLYPYLLYPLIITDASISFKQHVVRGDARDFDPALRSKPCWSSEQKRGGFSREKRKKTSSQIPDCITRDSCWLVVVMSLSRWWKTHTHRVRFVLSMRISSSFPSSSFPISTKPHCFSKANKSGVSRSPSPRSRSFCEIRFFWQQSISLSLTGNKHSLILCLFVHEQHNKAAA